MTLDKLPRVLRNRWWFLYLTMFEKMISEMSFVLEWVSACKEEQKKTEVQIEANRSEGHQISMPVQM